MTMCRVDEMTRPVLGVTIAIHRDSETKEYRARIAGNPDSDYFTDDLLDADKTAKLMFDQEVKVRLAQV